MASRQEVKELLQKAFGPGTENLYDFEGDVGRFLDAIGASLKQYGFDMVDTLRQELNPATMVQKIPDWEQTCGLSSTNLALFGTTAQRRNQVISKLRENSTFNLADLRAALQPFFLYQDSTQIQILEPNRDLMRKAHTYPYTGMAVTVGVSSFENLFINVLDDPKVSAAGAFINLRITTTDVSQVALMYTSADGTTYGSYDYGFLGSGSATNAAFVIGGIAVAGSPIKGLWRIRVLAGSAACTVNACSLFVEGIGRNYDTDGSERGQGLGAALFEFAVIADQDLLGAGFDLNAARRTLRRMTPAHCGSTIVVKAAGAADVCAIPDLITTLPDAAIPCVGDFITTLYSIWSIGPGHFFFVGQAAIQYQDPLWYVESVNRLRPVISGFEGVNGIWGSSENDIWAMGYRDNIIHYNGAAWVTIPFGPDDLVDVWGTAANDVWAAGFGAGAVVYHYDGTNWSLVFGPLGAGDAFLAIFGFSSTDIWVGGATGIDNYHWDGTTWTSFATPLAITVGIWGAATNDVWSVGFNGGIAHYDGTSWTAAVSPTVNSLFSVWGTAANNIWAVGFLGTILHYDGTNWTTVTSPTAEHLFDVRGSGPNDIWAVGANAAIIHYNGTSWSSSPVQPSY